MEAAENWVFQCKNKEKVWISRTRKVSFIVVLIGFLFYLVSFLTPYWIAYKENEYTMNIGLFFGCIVVKGKITCAQSPRGGSLNDLLLAAQIFSSFGLTTLFTAVCCGMMVFYWPNKYRRLILRVASSTSFVSCALILLAIGLYMGHYKGRLSSLHFAFYFCILGVGFTPFAGVMFLRDANTNMADGSSDDDNGLQSKNEKKKLIGKSKLSGNLNFAMEHDDFWSNSKDSSFISARPPVSTFDNSMSRQSSRTDFNRSNTKIVGHGDDLQPIFTRRLRGHAPQKPKVLVSEFSDSLQEPADNRPVMLRRSTRESDTSFKNTAKVNIDPVNGRASAGDMTPRINSPLPRPGSENSVLTIHNIDVSDMKRSPSRMSIASQGSRQGNDWIEQSFTYNEIKYPIKRQDTDDW